MDCQGWNLPVCEQDLMEGFSGLLHWWSVLGQAAECSWMINTSCSPLLPQPSQQQACRPPLGCPDREGCHPANSQSSLGLTPRARGWVTHLSQFNLLPPHCTIEYTEVGRGAGAWLRPHGLQAVEPGFHPGLGDVSASALTRHLPQARTLLSFVWHL